MTASFAIKVIKSEKKQYTFDMELGLGHEHFYKTHLQLANIFLKQCVQLAVL